jgi:hypothetical protein
MGEGSFHLFIMGPLVVIPARSRAGAGRPAGVYPWIPAGVYPRIPDQVEDKLDAGRE